MVTQYDIEWYTRIEHALGKKLDEYPLENDKSAVLVLQERVSEAVKFAHLQAKEENSRFGKRFRDKDDKPDDEDSSLKHRSNYGNRKNSNRGNKNRK